MQVYHELYESQESVDQLNRRFGDLFSVFQKSLHDEILLSLRRLFDSAKYHGDDSEYLSQRNLVEKYESHLSHDLVSLRQETSDLRKELNFKEYSDLKVAHNLKEQLVSPGTSVKHNLNYDKLTTLLEKSVSLICGIKASVLSTEEVAVPVDFNEKFEGKGAEFLEYLDET